MDVIVTGSFDPFTLGHLRLVEYARQKYDKVYVVALVNNEKDYMFSLEEKKEIIKHSVAHIDNVVVDAYAGLTADYMHEHNIFAIVRGIRDIADESYEKNLAKAMKEFDARFETDFYYICDDDTDVSSTFVRELLKKGENIGDYVCPNACEFIKALYFKKI